MCSLPTFAKEIMDADPEREYMIHQKDECKFLFICCAASGIDFKNLELRLPQTIIEVLSISCQRNI